MSTAYLVDAERYEAFVDSGALDDQRVELLDGIINETSPQSPVHDVLVQRLTVHCAGFADGPRVQMSLRVADNSVLEPDLALVDGPPRIDRHPESALLVVEVAVSSHVIDRGRKAELYAAVGIPVYWLVDAPARTVELRTDPAPAGYRTMRTLGLGDVLPTPCEGVGELAVSALLADI